MISQHVAKDLHFFLGGWIWGDFFFPLQHLAFGFPAAAAILVELTKSAIKCGFPDVWIKDISLWLSNLIIKSYDLQIFWIKSVKF